MVESAFRRPVPKLLQMSNDIPRRQNEDLQLRELVAQRRLYLRAKQVLAWQIVSTVVLVAVWSVLVIWLPKSADYAALYGLAAVAVDLLALTPWQNSLKQKAAGVQELFDCYVLSLPWQDIKAGPAPDTETIAEWSCTLDGVSRDDSKLRNWYPAESGALPLALGRIICQRANCWWDAKLRRRFAIWIAVAAASLFALISVVGLVGKVSLEQFLLAGITPFLPVVVTSIRQFSDQRGAAARLDDLRAHSERLWTEALAGRIPEDELTRRSRTLQDEIFELRRRNPLIFDWIYWRLRDYQEELMNKCASDLVQEAQLALNSK